MKFRREDDGRIVDVPYDVAIRHSYGWITLEDGVQARRVPEEKPKKKPRKVAQTGSRPIYSDALGFGQHQLADFEADRLANGFTGVEFVRDPAVPEFLQVKCNSRDEFNRYAAHRNLPNKGSIGGVRLTQEELDRASEFVKEKYPCQGSTISSV